MSNELEVKKETTPVSDGGINDVMRMATAMAASDIVPKEFQNKPGNCVIAVEMAQRMKMPLMSVIQNIYIVHGKPSWSSSAMIGAINATGNFEPLDFVFTGEGDDYGCHVETVDRRSGKTIKGPKIDWKMVNAEGWSKKSGSKWKTMSEVMFRYRAASFFGRLYSPEVMLGMYTREENIEMIGSTSTDDINAELGITDPEIIETEQTEGSSSVSDELAESFFDEEHPIE